MITEKEKFSIWKFTANFPTEYSGIIVLFLFYLYSIWPFPAMQNSDGWWCWAPRLDYAVKQLLGGQLPLWNEYQFCGIPFFADGVTCMLNPSTIFYALLKPNWAYSFGIVSAYPVLLIGSWLYFRTAGFSWVAALVGTIAYAYSGQVIFQSVYHSYLPMALFPWILFSFRKYDLTRKQGWRISAFLLTYLSLMGGQLQWAILSAVSAVIEGMGNYSLIDLKKTLRKRGIPVALALLSASVIIVPTVETFLSSHRRHVGYLGGGKLIGGLLLPQNPYIFSVMTLFGDSGGFHGYPNYFYYIGITPIALALFGARAKFRKVLSRPLFVYSLFPPMLVIAIYQGLLTENFHFGVQTDPFRGMFIFLFALSILCAVGTEAFIEKVRDRTMSFPPPEFLASLLITIYAMQLFRFTQVYRQIVEVGAVVAAGFLIGIVVRKASYRSRTITYSVWLVAILAINAFPAGKYLSGSVTHTHDIDPVDTWRERSGMPIEKLASEGRVINIGGDNFFEMMAIRHKIRALGGYNTFFPESIFLRIRDEGLIAPISFDQASRFKNNTITDPGVLARYGVVYLVTDKGVDGNFSIQGWVPVFPRDMNPESEHVYVNPKYVGRSYIADEMGNILRGAIITKNTDTLVAISADGTSGEKLVLSDSWSPGWDCYDNGVKTIGFNDNGFRGYRFKTSGHHEIEWRYCPRSYIYGGILSAIGLVAFIALSVSRKFERL